LKNILLENILLIAENIKHLFPGSIAARDRGGGEGSSPQTLQNHGSPGKYQEKSRKFGCWNDRIIRQTDDAS
jgi:hypothetical protein